MVCMLDQITFGVEEKLSSLFQPDTLLPAQYLETFGRKGYLEPEKRLMLAILQDGVACFQNRLSARDGRGGALFREAEEWILEEDGDWIYSFENICEVLGFSPRYVRQGLIHWKERKLAEWPRARIYHLTPGKQRKKPSVVAFGRTGRSSLRAAAR